MKIGLVCLKSLARATHAQLGLRTHFTAGERETRAWTIVDGMTAPQCAGVIHTGFEQTFIKAETVGFDDFVDCKSHRGAKEKGRLRL